MLDLLKEYSIHDLLIFMVLFALSIKGCISFIDWLWKRLHHAVDKANRPQQLQKGIEQNNQRIEELQQSLEKITKMIHTLTNSDKDAIKAFITREHHYFCYQKGWIDDYSLDCIERRYNHYKEQGGNSFIKNLMLEIRQLPRHPSELDIPQQHEI